MNDLFAFGLTKIRDRIWVIGDEDVCCTLVRGSEMAILADTGYGNGNLRQFVEANITTPYIVINTHGHPDHIGGNHWFEEAYLCDEERDVLAYYDQGEMKSCPIRSLEVGRVFELGDLHVEVVPLFGHTKGSVGLLVREERLLIAGDALNDWLWLFPYGSLSMKEMHATLERALELEFDTYLAGHSDREYPKAFLRTHLYNIEHLKVADAIREETIGYDTFISEHEDEYGKSRLFYTLDKI